jgi:hypothetical protein
MGIASTSAHFQPLEEGSAELQQLATAITTVAIVTILFEMEVRRHLSRNVLFSPTRIFFFGPPVSLSDAFSACSDASELISSWLPCWLSPGLVSSATEYSLLGSALCFVGQMFILSIWRVNQFEHRIAEKERVLAIAKTGPRLVRGNAYNALASRQGRSQEHRMPSISAFIRYVRRRGRSHSQIRNGDHDLSSIPC